MALAPLVQSRCQQSRRQLPRRRVLLPALFGLSFLTLPCRPGFFAPKEPVPLKEAPRSRVEKVPVAEAAPAGNSASSPLASPPPPAIASHWGMGELLEMLRHVYGPEHGDGQSLTWEMEQNNTRFRTSVTVLPFNNQTFNGEWSETESAAAESAILKLFRSRLSCQLCSCKVALHDLLSAALPGISFLFPVEVENGTEQKIRAVVQLPEQVFASGSTPEGLVLDGEGADRKEAIEAAARQALRYVCAYVDHLPAMKALSEGKTKSPSFKRATDRVAFNLRREIGEEEIREMLTEFGALKELELKEFGKGEAVFKDKIAAWAASRILDRGLMDGRVVFVEQQQQQQQQQKQQKQQKQKKQQKEQKQQKQQKKQKQQQQQKQLHQSVQELEASKRSLQQEVRELEARKKALQEEGSAEEEVEVACLPLEFIGRVGPLSRGECAAEREDQ
eukprot:CAMPEP_0204531994 /NCGR_PEP_ID=MMETSP0661-20131031/11479_1 /ASSEMBLY_ACC=CAM_ASM_000606 /TAXON_ID=109239 /ORGANISM="Alexandrium margalefi, Strain AMGDE01CS-322" /LENGTH=446 /DNA_ID=CAMNT_0051538193 /DNA_START=80 /DNA_END=1418 /DNA_ORIENTATION=-